MSSNNSLIGANSIVFIVRYISIDGTQSSFKKIGSPILTDAFSSMTFSALTETSPVYSLGKSVGGRYAIGPLIIRGKLTFTILNNQSIFELTDFYLKSRFNQDGTINENYDDIELYTRQNEIISNNGSINGTTINPFDMWVYNHSEDGKTKVTSLFGIKIDTATVVKDAYNQDIKIAEFNALDFNDNIPKEYSDQVLWASNYDEYVKGMINSKNQKGRLPFRRI